ncbi:MAG: RDD family protein [Luteimonas sp.]
MSPLAPAGAWRRYVAWSLDSALLATLATGLTWPRLVATWRTATSGWTHLSALLGRALADGVLQPASPGALAGDLLADPAVQDAAAGVQHAISQLLLAWLLCYALLAAIYHVGFERSRWQGSPGKRALGLRVVDAHDDRPVATGRLAWRHLAGTLSWLTLNLGHALVLLPPRRRALHDWLTGTRVVSESASDALPAWARAWLGLQVVAMFALLAWGVERYLAALQVAVAA